MKDRVDVFEMMKDIGIKDESVEDREESCDAKAIRLIMEGKDSTKRAETILDYLAHDSEVFPKVLYRLIWELIAFTDMERAANNENDQNETDSYIGYVFREMSTDTMIDTWPKEYSDWLDSLLKVREEASRKDGEIVHI